MDYKAQANAIRRGDAIKCLCAAWKHSRLPCLLKAPEAQKASVPYLTHILASLRGSVNGGAGVDDAVNAHRKFSPLDNLGVK